MQNFLRRSNSTKAKKQVWVNGFIGKFMACLNWLTENPRLPRLRKGYRRINLKVFPFYLAYVTEGELIWVLAVAHVSRKPGYWKKRL